MLAIALLLFSTLGFSRCQSDTVHFESGPYYPSSQYDDPNIANQYAVSSQQQSISSFARGSHQDNSFKLKSATNRGQIWSNRRPQSYTGSQGSSSSYAHLSRSKRSLPYYPLPPPLPYLPPPPPPGLVNRPINPPVESFPSESNRMEDRQYYYPSKPYYEDDEEECQYHTLLNGDSEMILRKLLPMRLRGRTILRHCIKKPPHPDDPRYKVLLRGNQKSSFGSFRVSMKS